MDKSRKKLIAGILESCHINNVTAARIALMSDFSDAQLCGLMNGTAIEITDADFCAVAKKYDFITVTDVEILVEFQRVRVYGTKNRFFKEGDDDPKSWSWRTYKDETYCVPRETDITEIYDIPEVEDVISFKYV